MIFCEKKIIRYYIIFTYKRSICSNIRNFQEIADDHNSGTEYARDIGLWEHLYVHVVQGHISRSNVIWGQ